MMIHNEPSRPDDDREGRGGELRFPLLLDGPMGTELGHRGMNIDPPLWSARALLDAPELVEQIHLDYIAAGADVITVNSFRTNRRAIVAGGLEPSRAEELTRRAVAIAKRARDASGRQDVLIAGSDAPVEDCYSPELVPPDDDLLRDHEKHIQWMVEEGCDLVLVETMNSLREARGASSIAATLAIPFIVSFVTDPSGENLLDGTSLADAASVIAKFDPAAILSNCASPRATVRAVEVLAKVRRHGDGAWKFGGYPNGGEPDSVLGWGKVCAVPTKEFLDAVRQMRDLGAEVFGSCCGTSPSLTRRLSAAVFDGLYPLDRYGEFMEIDLGYLPDSCYSRRR